MDGVHRLAWAKHDLRPPAEPTMRSFPEARRRRIVRRLSFRGSKGQGGETAPMERRSLGDPAGSVRFGAARA